MPLEKRIAKKGVSYYSSTYRRITFMFISCILYPVLGVVFLARVSDASVTDHTPSKGIDVTALVGIFAKNIAIFGALAFLALTALGVLQVAYAIRAHNRIRKETLGTYKSIGMTDESIRKVLKYEYMTTVFHAFVSLIFITVFIVIGVNSF